MKKKRIPEIRIPRSQWRQHARETLEHAGISVEPLPSGGVRIRGQSEVLCLSDLLYLTGPELRKLVRDAGGL